VTVAVCVPPLYLAVTVADAGAATLEVVTVRLAVFWPARTTTLAGKGNAALLLTMATTAPPAGAAALSVRLSVAAEPPLTLAGDTDTELSVGKGAAGVIVMPAVWVPPLYFAMIVTGVDEETTAACADTIADIAPGGTANVAGNENAALLLESVTVAPPAGAAALKVTVTVSVAPLATLACETDTATRLAVGAGATVTTAVFAAPL